MKQNQLDSLQKLKQENLENIFNVHQDKNGNYFYNLLQTIELPSNLPEGYYNTYTVKYQDTWANISYNVYNTPNLWWIIVGANNILDPTRIPTPGTVLKIYKIGVVNLILGQLTSNT